MSRFVFFQILVWLIVPAALGEGFESPPEPQPDDSPRLAPSIGDGRVVVSVLWPEDASLETATLVLADPAGAPVSSVPVMPEGGAEVAYTVAHDLDFVAGRGYRYRAQLVDGRGQPLAEPAAMLVGLCPSPEGCTYRSIDGVDGDAIIMGRELFELLEDLEAIGSADVLGDAFFVRPDLAFQIYWLADQIFRALGDGRAGDECVCTWVAEFRLEQPERTDLETEAPPSVIGEQSDWLERRVVGPGANLRSGAQLLGGDRRTITKSGESRAGLHLRCYRILGWSPASWAGLDLQVPQLEPCERMCPDASITRSGEFWVSVGAKALATDLDGARGYGSASISSFLDDSPEPEWTLTAEAEVIRLPGGVAKTFSEFDGAHFEQKRETVSGRDMSLRFRAAVDVEACLASGSAAGCPDGYRRPFYDDGSWAWAQSKVTLEAQLDGESSCAQPMASFVQLLKPTVGQGSKDGVVIVPWRP